MKPELTIPTQKEPKLATKLAKLQLKADVHTDGSENQEGEVTFLPGFCDDVSSRFAHDLGNIQGTVNLLGNCDSPVHCLRFHLKHTMATHTHTHNLDNTL